MIEKMKLLYLATPVNKKKQMLFNLRDFGAVHIREKKAPDLGATQLYDRLFRTYQVLKDLKDVTYQSELMSDEEFDLMNSEVEKAIDDSEKFRTLLYQLTSQHEKQISWGDFNPEELAEIKKSGVQICFYQVGRKEYEALCKDKNISFIRLAPLEKQITLAVINDRIPPEYQAAELVVPEKSLSTLALEIEECKKNISESDNIIKNGASHLNSYKRQLIRYSDNKTFSSAEMSTCTDSKLAWLCGYIPESDEERFRLYAKEQNWAYAIGNVDEDDEYVPTKIKYNKVTGLMKPVFKILGTVPGYREYDISFWFLSFFALFFAMIMGDAGYGLLFLAISVIMNCKLKKTTDVNLLLYLFSFTTILWGAVTGTWFGLEKAMELPFLRLFVIKSLANYPEYFGNTTILQQNTIMKFCFSIGMIQLNLACIISIKRKIGEKNLSFIADIGWSGIITGLYFIILMLLIGESGSFKLWLIVISSGFVLISLFGGMKPGLSFTKGLKAGLADLFTNFLNTISTFGNLMSYIRLFAVGLAGLAIAQSFNQMALGMNGIFILIGVIIFILGHSLNLVMGILSVVVHGVRLNLLEFSGQLGMEWSGIEYDPFTVKLEE